MPWLKGKAYSMVWGGGKWARTVADLDNTVNVVAKIMAEHGVTKEPLGLDATTSELLYQQAFKQRGIEVVDAKKTMFDARMIKNEDEIECIRMACSNADAAFADMADAIRPGITECELVGIGMKTLYTLGTDEAQEFVCCSGPRTNPLHIDYTDRQIRPGDLVIIDINGNSWQGYKSCYYRTFSCGKPTKQQEEAYDLCRDLLIDPMKSVKAGVSADDLLAKFPTGTQIYGGHAPGYFGYKTWEEVPGLFGHGIGLSLHELPAITKMTAASVKLEEGMVLAFETWAGHKGGKDGVRLEENVVVTKDGYDLLTLWPIDKLTECWA
jgi:Xaa-Pro dipeptidase